jgi:hypothetical protein
MSKGLWGSQTQEFLGMCDYSLQSVLSRPAKVGDRLTTRNFGTGTRGFAAPENSTIAVCVLPGTELAFSSEITVPRTGLLGWKAVTLGHTTAIFRQINKDKPGMHHDALELPDGQIVLLTELCEGQEAAVLQLPAQPATAAEEEAHKRVAHTG